MTADLLSFPDTSRAKWHCIQLSEAELLDAVHEIIADAFEHAYIKAHRPIAMTLWMAFMSDGGARLYLSPGSIRHSAALIDTYAAESCAAPSRPPHLLVLKIAGGRHRSDRVLAEQSTDPRTA